MTISKTHTPPATDGDDRRGFVKRVAAVVVGALCAIIPGGAALRVFLAPLFKRGGDAAFVPVATLDALPADGVPRMFKIVSDRTDAWNHFAAEPIGTVFLRRTAEKPNEVIAFNAVCPHLGCMVGYQTAQDRFYCPCHQSAFKTDGALIPPSAAARGLDTLEVKLDPAAGGDGARVLVKFENFRSGIHEKVVKS
jgi:menaquinol-cytochrome c reductase iron-sulfur subunit